MSKKKYHLLFDGKRKTVCFNALLACRNKLIAQGRYTDLVDEIMIKLKK